MDIILEHFAASVTKSRTYSGVQQSLEIWGGQVVLQSKILTSVFYKAPSDLPKSGGAAAPPAPTLGASLIYSDL